jgi:hypothetical protein
MPADMKPWQVRDAAHDAIWHIRLVATSLQHALRPWGGVAVLLKNSPQEVHTERARCMNVISGLCGRRNIKGRPFWSRVWVLASIPTERNALNG